jgi:Holliday junction resolvase RusA-like endonuclease
VKGRPSKARDDALLRLARKRAEGWSPVLRIRVQGEPVPRPSWQIQTRARSGRPLPHFKAYMPSNYKRWQNAIRAEFLAGKVRVLWNVRSDIPVGLGLMFFLLRPASVRDRALPHVKPDLDNLVKGVQDALKGIVYADDAQVCRYLDCAKVYVDGAREQGVEVTVWEYDAREVRCGGKQAAGTASGEGTGSSRARRRSTTRSTRVGRSRSAKAPPPIRPDVGFDEET